MSNFRPLEVVGRGYLTQLQVGRGSETQLQVGENLKKRDKV